MEKNELMRKTKRSNFFQVDFLKAWMILLVVLDHSRVYIGPELNKVMGFELWERIAIPVFLVIMGFNIGKSIEVKEDKSLRNLYSWSYFKNKFWRFIFPFLICYVISMIIGFSIYGTSFSDRYSDNWILDHIILGLPPFGGPGIWFIPIIFQSILILPLLYKIFNSKPKIVLFLCFVIEILMHFITFLYVGEITSYDDWMVEAYFRYSIFMYLSAIGIGLWFSKDHNIFSKKNIFIWILLPISLFYLIQYQFFDYRIAIDGAHLVRGEYNYLVFPYSAFIILLIIKIFPKKSEKRLAKAISWIGKSTFHIFLIQNLYFEITYTVYDNPPYLSPLIANIFGLSSNDVIINILLLIMNWIITVSIGVLWWFSETKLRNFRKSRKSQV
jgi:hypothetical protein